MKFSNEIFDYICELVEQEANNNEVGTEERRLAEEALTELDAIGTY